MKGVATSCQRSRIPPEMSLSGTYPPHSAAFFLQRRTGTSRTPCITTNHRAVGCGDVDWICQAQDGPVAGSYEYGRLRIS